MTQQRGVRVTATSHRQNLRHMIPCGRHQQPAATRGAATRRIIFVVLAFLLGTATAWSAADPIGRSTTVQLQRIVDKAAIESGAVGGQVSVIVGAQRADFVFGSANVELNQPMTSDTVIQIGSTTKVFNAALVMTLVEQHRLDLDVPIIQYMPRFRVADAKARETITLRQLLSMSSGLDNGPYTQFWNGDEALASYVDSLRTLPQVFAPGRGFGYSNAGTSIAGRVVEVVTGNTWDAELRARILEPAGLTHTITLAEDLPFQRVSVGHVPGRNGLGPTVVRPWYITRAQACRVDARRECAQRRRVRRHVGQWRRGRQWPPRAITREHRRDDDTNGALTRR